MTDILDTIDTSLEEVEEQLLLELESLRHTTSPDQYCRIDPDMTNTLMEIVDELFTELQNSGDRTDLQLLTKRHEMIYARIDVVQQLLTARIAAARLDEAHDGVELKRRALERRVLVQRKAADARAENRRGMTIRPARSREAARNRINVTRIEEAQLDMKPEFLDMGIYSASRELAMLANLTRGGTLDASARSEPAMGRAVFHARELTTRLPRPVFKRTSFNRQPEPDSHPAPAKRDIAQTPEEIRRKLEARRNRTNAGKAVFAARDIEPPVPQEHYGRKRREEASEQKPANGEKPRTGRAVFEARDLSNSPFSDKDS